MVKPLNWQALLVDGYEPLRQGQRIFRRLPRDPRCKLCQSPFAGVGGRLVGFVGRRPSRKNPNLCQYCFDHLPGGGIEIDIGVVFADVRGSTTIGEKASATEFAGRLNQFYATAAKVLIHHDGLVDKLIGDEGMALFIPGMAGRDYRRKAARAAVELAAVRGDLPVGVAAYAGIAFVGSVGSGTVMDFTALGDAVNIGARLQSYASAGEVVLSSELYALVRAEPPGARPDRVVIRGREAPVEVAVLNVGSRQRT
jgi:adenylate cyclase